MLNLCLCACHFWVCACTRVCIQCRQLEVLKWLLWLLQRKARSKWKRRRLHKKERQKEVPAQTPVLHGLSSCRVKAPIERKQGHLRRSSLAHTNTSSLTYTLEQNNSRASVSAASAQQSSTGSRTCLDLKLCAKNNKDEENVGADMQRSLSAFYVCMDVPLHTDRYSHCVILQMKED